MPRVSNLVILLAVSRSSVGFVAPTTTAFGRVAPTSSPRPPARGAARRWCPPPRAAAETMADEAAEDDSVDFLVTDSLGLPASARPSLGSALANPRDAVAVGYLTYGLALSAANVLGLFGAEVYGPLIALGVGGGALSALAAAAQLALGYNLRRAGRPGIADDTLVTAFGGAYTGAVSWLALRTSALCPAAVAHARGAEMACAAFALVVFAFGVLAPLGTLVLHDGFRGEGEGEGAADAVAPEALLPGGQLRLSATERTRVQGLLAIGLVGALFAPDCALFLLRGDAWWARVAAAFPAQQVLEPSTALFAALATEASMVAHRCGKAAVAPFKTAVVPFGLLAVVVYAILPTVANFAYNHDGISFFSFYSE